MSGRAGSDEDPAAGTAELTSVDAAAALDQADPLGGLRESFVGSEQPLVYLDGNSLGRLPRATAQRLRVVVEQEWGSRLIRGWQEGWMELPLRAGDRLGAVALGAAPGQVALADSTTVCLYKLASAAIAARPDRTEIITDHDNFPTDRYVLEGLAAAHGLTIRWLPGGSGFGPEPEQVAALAGERTALIALSHVAHRSAFLLDLPAITAIAHEAGALALWDLSHSAGAVPIGLDDAGVDLAVGCTYKYLNSGPGAPAFLYVAAEHHASLRQPVWGWLGRDDPFAMAPGFTPAPGITAMLSGTPPVLALSAVLAGLELLAEAGLEAVRAKGVALGEYAIALADAWLSPWGAQIASPRQSERRGSHVAVAHPDARALCRELIAAGVIVDFREPDIIRAGLSPLSTSYTDVRSGLLTLRDLLTAR